MQNLINNSNQIIFVLNILKKRILCIQKVITFNETDEINEEILESFLQKYQKSLEEPMKGTKFVIDSIDLLHYNVIE